MPATLSISEDSTYMLVTIVGSFTLPLAREMLDDLVRLQAATGVMKVLVDARQQAAPLDMMEAYEVGHVLTQKPLRTLVFAVIIPVPLTEYHFLETVAVNRGVNIRYFDDYDRALAWLRGPPAHGSME